MTTNYNIGDFLIRIKNAALAGRSRVVTRSFKLGYEVAKVLSKEGFVKAASFNKGELEVILYDEGKKPAISGVSLVSKPGLRVYKNTNELAKIKGFGTMLISSPKGIVTLKTALKERVGGEVMARVW